MPSKRLKGQMALLRQFARAFLTHLLFIQFLLIFALKFVILEPPSTTTRTYVEKGPNMTGGLIVAGLGLAALGYAGRYAARYSKPLAATLKKSIDQLPQGALSKYYKGGFEPKMSKREAGLILGLSPSASKQKVKEAHKRIMLLNHPDRGGSPYLAAKINEAKDYLDSSKPGMK